MQKHHYGVDRSNASDIARPMAKPKRPFRVSFELGETDARNIKSAAKQRSYRSASAYAKRATLDALYGAKRAL